MKKLFFTAIIFFISVTSSFAVLFIDAEGDYISTGEYKPVAGFGGGIGFGLTDDVNILISGYNAENSENVGLSNESRYSYTSVMGVIEYIPPIDFFEQYRLYWKNSLGTGWSRIHWESDSVMTDVNENGVIITFKTGLQFNFTQIVAPYIDFGYQKSFFPSTANVSINGWQADVGVRFYILGSRDYEAGY